MTRDEIIESHYGKARAEMALVHALWPVVIAIFVIVIAASIGRPSAGAMLYGLLCAAPLLLLRDTRLRNSKPLAFAVGLIVPAAAGYLATAALWVAGVTALLGLASVWIYYAKRDNTLYHPNLNDTGQENLNSALREAGFEPVTFHTAKPAHKAVL